MKKIKYLILLVVAMFIFYFMFTEHRVNFMFINHTEDKVYKIVLFIDGAFRSEFYCAPQMIPIDLITFKLPAGKHYIRVDFSDLHYSWSSSFWVVSNEYYQVYFQDITAQPDSLSINFNRTLLYPVYQ